MDECQFPKVNPQIPSQKKMWNVVSSVASLILVSMILVMVSIFGSVHLTELATHSQTCITDCDTSVTVNMLPNEYISREDDCSEYCPEACSHWSNCSELDIKDFSHLTTWDVATDYFLLMKSCVYGQCIFFIRLRVATATDELLDQMHISQYNYVATGNGNLSETPVRLEGEFGPQDEWSGLSTPFEHPINIICANLLAPNQTNVDLNCILPRIVRIRVTTALELWCRYFYACTNTVDDVLTNQTLVLPSLPVESL